MNYKQIVNIIKDTANRHAIVKETAEGDIYETLNSGEHKYPAIILSVQSLSAGEGDTLTLNGTLFYVDRLLQDNSNKLEVQALGMQVLKLIQDKIEEELGASNIFQETYTPFTEQFADLCAGAFVLMQLNYILELDCDGDFTDTLYINDDGVYGTVGYETAVVDVKRVKSIDGHIGDITLGKGLTINDQNVLSGVNPTFEQGENITITHTSTEEGDNYKFDVPDMRYDDSEVKGIINQIDEDLLFRINGVAENLVDLSRNIEEISTKVTKAEGSISELYGDVSNLNEEDTRLSNSITAANRLIDTLNEEVGSITNSITTIYNNISNLTNVVDNNSNNITSLTSDLQRIDSDLNNFDGRIYGVEVSINGINSDVYPALNDLENSVYELNRWYTDLKVVSFDRPIKINRTNFKHLERWNIADAFMHIADLFQGCIEDIKDITNYIDKQIDPKIPTAASSTNQLADKNFVNANYAPRVVDELALYGVDGEGNTRAVGIGEGLHYEGNILVADAGSSTDVQKADTYGSYIIVDDRDNLLDMAGEPCVVREFYMDSPDVSQATKLVFKGVICTDETVEPATEIKFEANLAGNIIRSKKIGRNTVSIVDLGNLSIRYIISRLDFDFRQADTKYIPQYENIRVINSRTRKLTKKTEPDINSVCVVQKMVPTHPMKKYIYAFKDDVYIKINSGKVLENGSWDDLIFWINGSSSTRDRFYASLMYGTGKDNVVGIRFHDLWFPDSPHYFLTTSDYNNKWCEEVLLNAWLDNTESSSTLVDIGWTFSDFILTVSEFENRRLKEISKFSSPYIEFHNGTIVNTDTPHLKVTRADASGQWKLTGVSAREDSDVYVKYAVSTRKLVYKKRLGEIGRQYWWIKTVWLNAFGGHYGSKAFTKNIAQFDKLPINNYETCQGAPYGDPNYQDEGLGKPWRWADHVISIHTVHRKKYPSEKGCKLLYRIYPSASGPSSIANRPTVVVIND